MAIDLLLAGCRPLPLAAYLKALGVLRLVASHPDGDPSVRGWWSPQGFHLRTHLSAEGLRTFLLEKATVTPIVAPWNGGSGFGPKDNLEAIEALSAGACERFAIYRTTIQVARQVRDDLGIGDKVEDRKGELLAWCRARLPDEALPWLDAAVVLGSDRQWFPPLLGTGGNDGRLDFTNNFMQRVVDLFDPDTGLPQPQAAMWLEGALFGSTVSGLLGGRAIGQFLPAGAGGANAGPGFDAESLVNPWDFVLMLEGATCFASAAVRRLESTGQGCVSIPFTVRAVGAGYGSASKADEADARNEMWLPIWDEPASLAELHFLLAEGRASTGRRPAANGLDFALATKTLGVDRGLVAFERIGFQVRNGLAYFATPLGRHEVARNDVPAMRLFDDLEQGGWLSRFRRWVGADGAATATRALTSLEAALFSACEAGEQVGVVEFQAVVVALGAVQSLLTRAGRKAFEAIPPVPPLSENWWAMLDDGSPDFDLAASLAGLGDGLRKYVEPVRFGRWEDRERDPDLVWRQEASLDANLIAVASRWQVATSRQSDHATSPFLRSQRTARAASLMAFLAHETDDDRISGLLRGLLLIQFQNDKIGPPRAWDRHNEPLPALYCLAKLCSLPSPKPRPGEGFAAMPPTPELLRLLIAGRGADAWRRAALRLKGAGYQPVAAAVQTPAPLTRRIAAALIFDVPPHDSAAITADSRSGLFRYTGLAGRVLRRPSSIDQVSLLPEGVHP